MLTVTLQEPANLDSIAGRWQAFEAEVECSFFQSWAWVGCLGSARYTDPVLIEAKRDGAVVAMALFNRRRAWPGGDRMWLGESGAAGWDSVFIEHNGVLLAPGEGEALRGVLAAALRSGRRGRIVVLSGLDPMQAACAETLGAACVSRQMRQAPFVTLPAAGSAEGGYVEGLSANTRYQLRRSARLYAKAGKLTLDRAASPGQAHEFLDALAVLHQSAWMARGRPGAFANPAFARFHHALIDRTDAVDLLRITAGGAVVGYLHNFRFRGRVCAYQSGFDYASAGTHAKPGMTCHHLAIERYSAEGMAIYDFLAGDDRYKTSLATAAGALHWMTLVPKWSLAGVTGRLKAFVSGSGPTTLPGEGRAVAA